MNLQEYIKWSLIEDVGSGDYTTLSCIDADAYGRAVLKIKSDCIIAGIELAQMIAGEFDNDLQFELVKHDGDVVKNGDVAFYISGKKRSLLTAERVILNCMQRMSGIATTTKQFVDAVSGTSARILDTRKTTPLNREIEKWAVRIGGGHNHRFGLFDMILIKDNHVDMCGGITNAIKRAKAYIAENDLNLKIEIEVRNEAEIVEVCSTGGVDRILIDNFKPNDLESAVRMIKNQFETEASGGIVLDNVRDYANTGVDFISVGALTHSFKSVDLSLKAL